LRFDGEYFSIRRTVDAREIWDKLIQNAWACVPYDTLLFVWKDGKRQLMRIGDLVKEWHANPKVHYEVLSLNLETLQLERKPITKVYEFANDKRLYEAETESGKVFVATEDHLVYRLTPEGSIESVPVSALRPGDFVAIAKTTEKDEAKDERAAWVDLRDQWQTLAAFGHGLTGEPIIQLLQRSRAVESPRCGNPCRWRLLEALSPSGFTIAFAFPCGRDTGRISGSVAGRGFYQEEWITALSTFRRGKRIATSAGRNCSQVQREMGMGTPSR
jgi:hypothetical protein